MTTLWVAANAVGKKKAFIFFRPSAFWISLGPRCATEMLWSLVRWFAH